MTAHRDPAAIAADLRDLAGQLLTMRVPVYGLADEVEALPVITAEEVATLRGIAASLAARDDATWLDQIADKLDPPTVETVEVVEPDPWALLAAVVAPVDDCDDPREWIRRRDAARAALAERGAP